MIYYGLTISVKNVSYSRIDAGFDEMNVKCFPNMDASFQIKKKRYRVYVSFISKHGSYLYFVDIKDWLD